MVDSYLAGIRKATSVLASNAYIATRDNILRFSHSNLSRCTIVSRPSGAKASSGAAISGRSCSGMINRLEIRISATMRVNVFLIKNVGIADVMAIISFQIVHHRLRHFGIEFSREQKDFLIGQVIRVVDNPSLCILIGDFN